MISSRFRSLHEDEWTSLLIEGEEEEAAWNILATRLGALDYDFETWDGEDWIPLGEEA